MKATKWLIVVSVLAGLLWLCYWGFCRSTYVSFSCGIRAEFASLPMDDKEFEAWLRSQPGVVSHTVHVTREEKIVEVVYIQSRNLFEEPPPLDLVAKFVELGYKGPVVLPERRTK